MNTDKIRITVEGIVYEYEKGATLLEISKDFAEAHATSIVAAIVNNNIKDMSTPLVEDCSVGFFDLSTEFGIKVYQRSLHFILILAARDLFPNGQVVIQHSLSKGLYCEFHLEYPLTEQDVKAVENRMREMIEADLPITKKTVPLEEAIALSFWTCLI